MSDMTVLIGENNCGKTTVLDSLRKCMEVSEANKNNIFSKYDYHFESRESDINDVPPIEIKLVFGSIDSSDFTEDHRNSIELLMDNKSENDQSLSILLRSFYDKSTKRFVTEYNFSDVDENVIPPNDSTILIQSIQEKFPVIYLPSLRESAKEFSEDSYFWKIFTEGLAPGPDDETKLRRQLFDLNEVIISNHTPFDEIFTTLKNAYIGSSKSRKRLVEIEVIPQRFLNLLDKAQIMLKSTTGASIPVSKHGSGVQSLSVLYLFDAFIRQKIKSGGNVIKPILAIEEPEAHLDSSTIREVALNLKNLSGQKIVTTHSGNFLSSIPVDKIYKIRRYSKKVEINGLKKHEFDKRYLTKFNYHIKSTRGSLFFSRCWFLVEGYTDANTIFELANLDKKNFDKSHISCIHFQDTVSFSKLIKFAMSFGIEWVALVDGDSSGNRNIRGAKKEVGEQICEERIFQLNQDNIEIYLFENGFSQPINKTLTRSQKTVMKKLSGKGKEKISIDVTEFAREHKIPVPKIIKTAIQKAHQLSRKFN